MEEILDCSGLCCPMPIFLSAKAIKKMSKNERLKVITDDPAFPSDVKAWVNALGYHLESLDKEDSKWVAIIRK